MKKKKKPREQDKDATATGADEVARVKAPTEAPPLWTRLLPALMGLVLIAYSVSGVISGEVHVPRRGGAAGVVQFHSSPVAFVLTELLVLGVGGLLVWGGLSGAFAPAPSGEV
jgi:hypothetical protein